MHVERACGKGSNDLRSKRQVSGCQKGKVTQKSTGAAQDSVLTNGKAWWWLHDLKHV